MTASYSAGSVLGGRYVLEERLGDGGMAEVWQARHLALGMRVAVKLLHRETVARPGARERFLTEAKVMARLATRRVVSVQDFGITRDGAPYLVMELVDGETLARKLAREGRIAPGAVARVLGQAARALDRAHALGIVHRDFKPENVLLTLDEDGALIAKVADFGVAKLLGDARTESELIGTPAYMAPEQLRDTTSISPLTDVWAFGVVAFELLTGRLPFTGRDLHRLYARIASGDHATATSLVPSLPPSFDAWFARACALEPADRFPTIRAAAVALAVALDEDAAGEETRALVAPERTSLRLPMRRRESSVPPPAPSDAPVPVRGESRVTFAGIAAVAGLALAFVLVGRISALLGEASRPVADGPARVAAAPPPVVASPASAVAVPEAVPVAPAVASSVAPRRFVPASLPPAYRDYPDTGEPRVAPSFKRDPYAE